MLAVQMSPRAPPPSTTTKSQITMGFSSSDNDDGNSSSDDTAELTRRMMNNANRNSLKNGGDKRKKDQLDEPPSSSNEGPTTAALQQERKQLSLTQPHNGIKRSEPVGGEDSSSNYSDSEDDRIAQKIAKLMGTTPKTTRTKKRPKAPFPPLEDTKRPAHPRGSEPADTRTDGDDESSLDARRIPRHGELQQPPPPAAPTDPGTDGDDESSLDTRRIARGSPTRPPPSLPIDLGTDGDDESSVDTTALLRRMQQRTVPVRKKTDDSSCDTNSSLLQQKLRTTACPRKGGGAKVLPTEPFADENEPPPSHIVQRESEGATWDDELSVLDDRDNDSENTEELTRRMRGLPAKDPGEPAEQRQPPIQEFVLPDQPSSSSSEDEGEPVPRDPPPAVVEQHHLAAPLQTTTATIAKRSIAPAQATPPSSFVNPYLQKARVPTYQNNPCSASKPVGQDSARSGAISSNPYTRPIRSNPQPETTPPGVIHEGLRKPPARFMSPSATQQTLPNPSEPTPFDDDIHDSDAEDGVAFGFAPTVTAAVERRKRDSIASFVPNTTADRFPPFQREPCTERRESVRNEVQRRSGYCEDDEHHLLPPNEDWGHPQSPLQEPVGYQPRHEEDQQYDAARSCSTGVQNTSQFAEATYEGNSHFNEPQRLFQALPSAQYNVAAQGENALHETNETGYQNRHHPMGMEGRRFSAHQMNCYGQGLQQHDFRQEAQDRAPQNPPFQPYDAEMAAQPQQFDPEPLYDDCSGSMGQPDFTLEPSAHCEVDYTQFHVTDVPAPTQQQRKPRIRDASKRAPRSRKGSWKRRKKRGGGRTAASNRRRPAQRGGARTVAPSAAAGDDPHLRNIGGAQISF